MNHSTPGLPACHQLLEFIQTHVHQVGDAIQPSHPLSFPSPWDLFNPGIKLESPVLQADSLPTELSVQFSSVTQSCPTLCNPMNHSMPGLPVHHHLPEFIQTHVHQVGDAILPSHPLSSPSPPAPNPSQHQSLFQ